MDEVKKEEPLKLEQMSKRTPAELLLMDLLAWMLDERRPIPEWVHTRGDLVRGFLDARKNVTTFTFEAIVEHAARRFHEAYEKLAPNFNYETRKASAVPWDQVPEKNKLLMLAVCRELLSAGVLA